MATPNLFQPVYEDQHKNASVRNNLTVDNDLKVGNDLSVCGNTFLKNVKKLDGSSMNNIRDILGDQHKELYSSITGSTMSFGTSIATSANCEIVAVGDPGYENGKGVVKVYKFLKDGGWWNQIGTDLKGNVTDQGTKNGHRAGTSVALSANGKIVAVGIPFFDSAASLNLKYDGIVRVYEWNGTSWIRRGNDNHLKGSSPSNNDQAGTSVALSDDGNIIIVGAPGYDPGIARVYKWNGTEWESMSAISGATGIGSSVDINGDGTVIISGAPFWGSSSQGTVVVYDLDPTGTGMWKQRGLMNSLQGYQESGHAVAISKDGTRILIGIPKIGSGKGTARVYDWNGTEWTRKGSDIQLEGISSTDGAGTSVSMSGDGNVIAIGYKYSETSLSYPVKLYYWNGWGWNKIGDRIEIKTTVAHSFVDFFSSSLSLNYDGTLMLLGARSSASEEAGKVQLFSSKKSIIDNDLTVNGNIDCNNKLIVNNDINISGDGSVYGDLLINKDIYSVMEEKIIASNGNSGDNFANSISVSGNYAIIGAPNYNNYRGIAYIFEYKGGKWIEKQKLEAYDGADDDLFGNAVAISDDFAIVGAPDCRALKGAVYIYKYNGTEWILKDNNEDKVYPESPYSVSNEDNFGKSIAISGNYAVIGAKDKAYIMEFNNRWRIEKELLSSDLVANDLFGYSVAISGNNAVIGAPYKNGKVGATYVFIYNGTDWIQTKKLLASDGEKEDHFGYSIAISGDYIIVGAPFKHTFKGAAYIYSIINDKEIKLLASDGAFSNIDDQQSDLFGWSVSISRNYAIVGAPNHKLQLKGAAYVFELTNTDQWGKIISGQDYNVENKKLLASDRNNGRSLLGNSVAISDNNILVGADRDDGNKGALYIFNIDKNNLNLNNVKISNTLELGEGISIRNSTYSSLNYLDQIDISHPRLQTFYLNNEYLMIGNPGANEVKIWKLKSSKKSFDFQSTLNSNLGGSLGSSIHIEGNYAIIGDVGDSSNKDTQFAFVYKNNNGTWEQKGQLSPQSFVSSVRQASDGFGKSVRIKYPYAFVGAPNMHNNNGDVFIFNADADGNWIPMLTSPNVGSGHRNNLSQILEYNVNQGLMGQSIDIGDDFLFIGIPGASSNKGQVKIMKNISGDWTGDLTSKTTTYTINNPNNTENDQFGFSVSYYDNYLVIGSPNESSFRGSIYLYKYDVSNDIWELKEKKMSRNEKEYDKFGYSVAIFKKKVVIGTGRSSSTNTQGGLFYLEMDDNDKLIYQCPRIQSGLDKQNGPLVVGISDYLVAGAFTGSELIRFYQNHSSIKTTNIVNTNFTRNFIGSAGGKLNEITNTDHLDIYYNEAYSGTMGVSFNVANYSSLNNILKLDGSEFDPRWIPSGPKDSINNPILTSEQAHSVAGNFWYSIFKKFNEDKDINSLPWRIGGTETNSETEINDNNWLVNNKFHTKKNVNIHNSVSILIFKITNLNAFNKTDIIANLSFENTFDNLELYSTIDNLNYPMDEINWEFIKYSTNAQSNVSSFTIYKDDETENKTYMLIFYKDYVTSQNNDNVEIIFNDHNLIFNNINSEVLINNTKNIGEFYNKGVIYSDSEIRFMPGNGEKDINLLRVDSLDGTTDKSSYGHTIKYRGSRSGIYNSLSFFTDNVNNDEQIEALTILQNGNIGISIDEPSEKLHVNGNSTVEGDLTVTNFLRPSTLNEISYIKKYERGDSARYMGIVATSANGNIIVVGNSAFNTQDIEISIVEYSNSNYETLQDISPFSGEGDTYAGNSSVAVNDDGSRFIVGNVDGEGAYQSYTGAFKIYERNGNQYTELIEVTGTSSGDYLGSVVDMNSKGDIVATLVPGQSQIKVYRQSDNLWYTHTISLYTNAPMPQSSYIYNDLGLGSSPDPNTRSFALSNDGNRLVAYRENYIFVYNWNGNGYQQASITSPSLTGGDATTYVSFDFNGDGTMFVVGFAGAQENYGNVFVYQLNNSTWSLRYNNMRLSGNRAGARFGFSVSMSNDGNSLAIGTQGMKGSEGYVKLYHWDSSTSTYTEKQTYPGPDLLGITDTAYGYSISLSKYGNTLVIGELKSYYTPVPTIKNGGLFIFRDISVSNELFIRNGNVGIGNVPVAPLSICGSSPNFNSSTIRGIHMGLISGNNQAAIEINGYNHAFIDFKLEEGGEEGEENIYKERHARIEYYNKKLTFETAAASRMTIDSNGNVGIGTDEPKAGLHVTRTGYAKDNAAIDDDSVTYLRYDQTSINTHNFRTDNANYAVSIIGNGLIYATMYVGASDERIKKNINEVDDDIALQKFRDISCCWYNYIDYLKRGEQRTIGFIAQQVKEHLPEAVQSMRDYIPDEMKIITDVSWNNTNMITNEIHDVSGVKYRFYVSDDLSGNEQVVEIVGNADNSFTFDQSYNHIFCYGKEVDDFHTLDKQKLFALNFSATQEIDRIQQKQLLDISGNKVDIELLKLENAELKTEVQTLKSQLNDVLSRLSSLENA